MKKDDENMFANADMGEFRPLAKDFTNSVLRLVEPPSPPQLMRASGLSVDVVTVNYYLCSVGLRTDSSRSVHL